ncbi:MAG: ATP-binding protein [Ignisphaera sp.]
MSNSSQEDQKWRYMFRPIIGRLRMDSAIESYLEQCIKSTLSMNLEEVPATLASIIDRSFASIASHNLNDFTEYGDYKMLDLIIRRVYADVVYGRKTKPYIVVLYGPPGTGKTTWVRNAVAKYLVRENKLIGIYIEATPGDFSSKFAGIPIIILRSLLNIVSVSNIPSVLLFDEADGIFLKPQSVQGGVDIEQHKLFSEFKSALSILLSRNYPLVIVFTTNYKDIIVKGDPALADRVNAWIEVLPPPTEVRIAMARNILPPIFKNLWENYPSIIQANALRAIKSGAEPPMINEIWVSSPWSLIKLPWIVPVMPYEADYLIGYLIAWGWNPLDKDLEDALTLDFSRAVALWDKNNPLFKVYARGIVSEIELLRRFDEEKNKIEKSFLRTFHVARGGLDEFEKILSISYKQFWSDVLTNYDKIMEEIDPNTLEWKKMQLVCSLMVHGIPPSLLHHSISKCTPHTQFINIVNRVLTTIGIVTNPIRHLFLPFMISYTEDPMMRFIEFRRKIEVYNKFLYRELREGKLLEPIRIMLLEKDFEKAWNEAKKSFNSLDNDIKPYIGTALTAVNMLHKAIHTTNSEEKGIILLNIYRDVDIIRNMIIKIAEELGIKRWLPIVLDTKSFASGGISVYSPDRWRVFDPTFFNTHIADETYEANDYSIAPIIEEMGHYVPNMIDIVAMEEKDQENQKSIAT